MFMYAILNKEIPLGKSLNALVQSAEQEKNVIQYSCNENDDILASIVFGKLDDVEAVYLKKQTSMYKSILSDDDLISGLINL